MELSIADTPTQHHVQTRWRVDDKRYIPYARTEHNLLEILEGEQFVKKFDKYGALKPFSKHYNEQRAKHKLMIETAAADAGGVQPLALALQHGHWHITSARQQRAGNGEGHARARLVMLHTRSHARCIMLLCCRYDAVSLTDSGESLPIPAENQVPNTPPPAAPATDAAPAADAAPVVADGAASTAASTDGSASAAADAAGAADAAATPAVTPPSPIPPPPQLPPTQLQTGAGIRAEIKTTVRDFLEDYLDEAVLLFHKDVPELKQRLCVEITEACKPKRKPARKQPAPKQPPQQQQQQQQQEQQQPKKDEL